MIVMVNARTMAVSEYSSSAVDVVAHGGELFFVQADKLVKLDAAGDEVVTSFIQTGDLTLAPDASANVAYAYVEKAADGAMTLTATADQDGKARTVAYAMPLNFPAGKARVSHVKLGRGVLGNAWSFKIGATGTAWSVTGLSIGVDRIRRRQR